MENLSKLYETRISLFRQEKDKIVYYLLIINKHTGAVNSLRKRYSELRDLHEKLEKKIKEYRLDIYLPIFPGRNLIQKTNNDLKKIEGRKLELQQYFNDLLKIVKLHSLDLLKEYLPTTRKLLNNKGNNTPIPMSEVENEKWLFKSRLSSNFSEDKDQDLLLVDLGDKTHQIKVTIDRYNYIDDTMYFYVSFYDNVTKEEWVYCTRYSTLKRFHETLQDKNLKQYLKKFPSRKIFGITNEDPESIEKRRKQLEEYLDYALSQEPVLENEYVKYFLEDTKNQYLQQKKKEDLKKKKMKKMQEDIIRKQANEIVEKARQQGKILDSDQLKKQLLSKISISNNNTSNSKDSDDESAPSSNGSQKSSLGEDQSNINQLVIRKKKSKGGNLNPNPKGLLKTILAIVPEEINITYVDE
ncbi:hypothetical protein ABPG72_022383 [Tetrahymena utriculariae]